jgi:hypothetical protein
VVNALQSMAAGRSSRILREFLHFALEIWLAPIHFVVSEVSSLLCMLLAFHGDRRIALVDTTAVEALQLHLCLSGHWVVELRQSLKCLLIVLGHVSLRLENLSHVLGHLILPDAGVVLLLRAGFLATLLPNEKLWPANILRQYVLVLVLIDNVVERQLQIGGILFAVEIRGGGCLGIPGRASLLD